ncbi:MAG: T9SS type A sorting domain-containing protein [bacterium]
MKKYFFLLSFFILIGLNASAQTLDLNTKMYYTCKVWGYAKYFHSEVSNCRVNWDSVLFETLDNVKSSETAGELNVALLNMLNAAGDMEEATMPTPDEIPEELKFNLNFNWFDDTILSTEVRSMLKNISNNFRPHENCQVEEVAKNDWLHFPQDNPIINRNIFTSYPNENERLFILFKLWNIIHYFSPNNDIVETSWDSTLYNIIDYYYYAANNESFLNTFKRTVAKLDDTHAQYHYSDKYNLYGKFLPRIILKYASENYTVFKSDYPDLKKGDVIYSIDGLSMKEWEDSLRPYISVGNQDKFRSYVASYMLKGDSASVLNIIFSDSDSLIKLLNSGVEYFDTANNLKSLIVQRNYIPNDGEWFYHHSCDSLLYVKYKKYDGNIGYVNMSRMFSEWDITDMYNSLYETKAIVLDMRMGTNSDIYAFARYMFPNKKEFVKYKIPDVTYPGTFYWDNDYIGTNNNPVPYKGNFIILCNYNTLSSGEFACMQLKAFPHALIVGSPTSGADGNISRIYISQDLTAVFSNLGVYYPDGSPTQRIGIVPDSIVCPTAEGIRSGRDEVLEKAFEIARNIVSVEDEKIGERGINIYPNPASEYIEIKLLESSELSESYNIQIYNILSECVSYLTPTLLHTPYPSQERNIRIDISSLQVGVYYIKIGGIFEKFIKVY